MKGVSNVLEEIANDVFEASGIAIELERQLTIPIIWTPSITTEDLQTQLLQTTRATIAARELTRGRITWLDYVAYLEEIKIDSYSLLDIWDSGTNLIEA